MIKQFFISMLILGVVSASAASAQQPAAAPSPIPAPLRGVAGAGTPPTPPMTAPSFEAPDCDGMYKQMGSICLQRPDGKPDDCKRVEAFYQNCKATATRMAPNGPCASLTQAMQKACTMDEKSDIAQVPETSRKACASAAEAYAKCIHVGSGPMPVQEPLRVGTPYDGLRTAKKP